jgi:hypothetical protein
MFKLIPSQDDEKLFFKMIKEASERHGVIGYTRMDFGKTGKEFWHTWFDIQERLNTVSFKEEIENVINSLREDGDTPPFASRNNLSAFCVMNPGKELNRRGNGYFIRTLNYSYYFRCLPDLGDYDIVCFTYDNRFLLPELAGNHEMPELCYSTMLDSGAVIMIKYGESGYYPCDYTTNDRQKNRETVDLINEEMEITKGQEQAMLAGSMFGWDIPIAKPWKYDENGKLYI